ncbi:MAG: hypothetical protein AUJ55_10845 [Proteobacteria bacterium CG1_02_64_396]|nr:MAG: hypothetical protein AUJ55_10845 [Proteobacteria bacterium CG1_02_64_396]
MAQSRELILAVLPTGPLQVNTTLIADPRAKRGWVIDPGGDPDRIDEWMTAQGVTPAGILLTHGHFDHIGAVAELKKRWGAPVALHGGDHFMVERASAQAQSYGLPPVDPFEIDHAWSEGEETFAELDVDILHTPGHTPGSLLIRLPSGVVATGDTLFKGSVGRTDFPASDPAAMQDSLRRLDAWLNEDEILIPGHGPNTTLADERRSNPFLQQALRWRAGVNVKGEVDPKNWTVGFVKTEGA